MKPILIIAAGGTFDALEYNFETGSVISFSPPVATTIIEKVRPDTASRNISVISPFQKDSDVMTDQDREEILTICKTSHFKQIVITHGTGTIIDTGQLLATHLKDKTIVLTGSLPYTHDPVYATFNLGNAVAACQLLPAGVYIASSGEIVPLNEGKIDKIKSGEFTYFVERQN